MPQPIKSSRPRKTRHGRLVLCAALILLTACAAPTPAPESESAPQADFVFYPPPPNEPRVQFLAKFTTVLDVSSGSGGMRSLVFGSEQFEEQLVNKPSGAAMHEGAIYVVDTRGGGYGVFDLAAGRTRFVRGSGSGAMAKPINITIDGDGTRYVTDSQKNAIQVFDANDRYQRTLGKPGQFQPIDVAIVGDRLYVTDIAHHQVQVLDKASGDLLFAFGEPGSDPGQLFHPTNLAVGPDGTIYVAETSNFRVSHFTPDGEFIRVIGEIGNTPGNFARPKGIAIDQDERIYVVDGAFGNVQVLDFDGTPLTFFGSQGETVDSLYLPTVVKLDYDNVEYFRKYAAPGFRIEYLVLVVSQFGMNKVVVVGFGAMTTG